MNAGSGGLLNDLAGELTLNTGSGTDELNLPDQNFVDATTYSISATQIARPGVDISYSGPVERLELKTGSAANAINIVSTAVNSPVTVIGGAGVDTVTAGAGSLDGFAAEVTINAGGATNTLNVDDSPVPPGPPDLRELTYEISGRDHSDHALPPSTYSQFSTLTLSTGTARTRSCFEVRVPRPRPSPVARRRQVQRQRPWPVGEQSTRSKAATRRRIHRHPDRDDPPPRPLRSQSTETAPLRRPSTRYLPSSTRSARPTPVFVSGKIKFGTVLPVFRPIDYSEYREHWARHPADYSRRADGDRHAHDHCDQRHRWQLRVGGATGNQFRNVEFFKWEAGDGNDTVVINNPSAGLFAPATRMEIVSTDQLAAVVRILGGTATSGTYEIDSTGVRVTHETPMEP